MRGAATVLVWRTELGRLPRHPYSEAVFQKRLDGPVSDRGYANLPAMTRGLLPETFGCNPILGGLFLVLRIIPALPSVLK
jgi:hypothetical protein